MFCTLFPISDRLLFVVVSGMHGMAFERIICDSAINEKNNMLRLSASGIFRIYLKHSFR